MWSHEDTHPFLYIPINSSIRTHILHQAFVGVLAFALAQLSRRQRIRAHVRLQCAHAPSQFIRPAAYVSIRQHTSEYVSIRQHTSAYVSIRQHTSGDPRARAPPAFSVYATCRIRQHTSAYVSMRHLYVWGSARTCASSTRRRVLSSCDLPHTSAYVSIRQHTSAYVSIR